MNKILSHNEQRCLLKKYRETGDIKHKEAVLKSNERYIHYTINRLSFPSRMREELVSEGWLVASRSLEKFDFNKRTKVSSYLQRSVRNELIKVINKKRIPDSDFNAPSCTNEPYEEIMTRIELKDDINYLLSALSSSDRQIVEKKFFRNEKLKWKEWNRLRWLLPKLRQLYEHISL